MTEETHMMTGRKGREISTKCGGVVPDEPRRRWTSRWREVTCSGCLKLMRL